MVLCLAELNSGNSGSAAPAAFRGSPGKRTLGRRPRGPDRRGRRAAGYRPPWAGTVSARCGRSRDRPRRDSSSGARRPPRRPCSAVPGDGRTGPPARRLCRFRRGTARWFTCERGGERIFLSHAPRQGDGIPEIRIDPDAPKISGGPGTVIRHSGQAGLRFGRRSLIVRRKYLRHALFLARGLSDRKSRGSEVSGARADRDRATPPPVPPVPADPAGTDQSLTRIPHPHERIMTRIVDFSIPESEWRPAPLSLVNTRAVDRAS